MSPKRAGLGLYAALAASVIIFGAIAYVLFPELFSRNWRTCSGNREQA